MSYHLIHIVPFDIGCSFIDYSAYKMQDKDDFIQRVIEKCQNRILSIRKGVSPYMLEAEIGPSVRCVLLDMGVGVFVVRGLNFPIPPRFSEIFQNDFAGNIYYQKKCGQKYILEELCKESAVQFFMNAVWSSVPKKSREFSASASYKSRGFSYVMTLYHIEQVAGLGPEQFEKNIDILMNPGILKNILQPDQWESIREKFATYTCGAYQRAEYDSTIHIASSWSAVAVIGPGIAVLDQVVEYEILLQASWFLYDSLFDDLSQQKFSYLELQLTNNLKKTVCLNINTILSANMSTSEMNTLQVIYDTSGIRQQEERLTLQLENLIELEKVKISNKQKTYSCLTEILLALFTLVSIHEPIAKLISGTFTKVDLTVGIVIALVFIVVSIFIIGKEK